MDNIENTLSRVKENYRTLELDDNFESLVFKKIKRKKIQRQVTASITIAVTFCALLFIGQGLLFHKTPEIKYAVDTEIKTNGQEIAKTTPGLDVKEEQPRETAKVFERAVSEKEEVPVMGEVIFSSSDRNTNYTVQQVAFNENSAAY